MKVGIKIVNQRVDAAQLIDSWSMCDDLGFDHVWVMDHLAPPVGDRRGAVLEAWTLLAAMTQVVRRARVGVMVSANTFRHPSLLAKMATTVDHLSNGRLELGLGAAWVKQEHDALGLPFPGAGQRIHQLDEACQVLKLLWTGQEVTFAGECYTLAGALAQPCNVQTPHPPIWIGGAGEQLTLRVVARHADAWNVYQEISAERFRYLSKVLDSYCAEIGRPAAEIRRTKEIRIVPEHPERTFDLVTECATLGCSDIILLIAGRSALTVLPTLGREILEYSRSLIGEAA